MSTPSRPRRKSKLTPFTVDELLDNPAMSGFVSFLDVHPEQRSSPPQVVESAEVSSQPSERSLPPGSNLPSECTLLAGGTLQTEGNLHAGRSVLSNSNLDTASTQLPECNLPAGGILPPDSNLPADRYKHPGSTVPPDSSLPPASDLSMGGGLQPARDFSPAAATVTSQPPVGTLLPGSELRTGAGRTVRIRPARSVQDAHTRAEHTLFELLWGKGTAETPQTRLIKAGLAEISRWTGAHKTSCRAYLRALIAKLAIEEAETFDACAGAEGARVYRVYSADAILERRRNAGFTHVIRTGAVSFIDPATGSKLLPD